MTKRIEFYYKYIYIKQYILNMRIAVNANELVLCIILLIESFMDARMRPAFSRHKRRNFIAARSTCMLNLHLALLQ